MENELINSTAYVTNEGVKVEKKRLTVFGVECVYLYLVGLGFAKLGWIVENCYRIATKGIVDCRFHLAYTIN